MSWMKHNKLMEMLMGYMIFIQSQIRMLMVQ